MKKEASKKSMKWIWLAIGIFVLVAALAVGAFLLFGQGANGPSGPVGGKAEIYWNVDRLTYTENSATGLSTREPGEDGLYHIKFAIDGSQVEYTVADKKLVNSIDAMDAMGLVVGDDGSVVEVIPAAELATLAANNLYVKTHKDGVITVNSSIALNGMEMQFNETELTGIYNCTDTAEMVGEISELVGMDRVQVYQNGLGETTHVFITDRAPETHVYWRLERFYDTTAAKTTRVPDENGVYTIAFAVNGEHVELKCKDESLVDQIDRYNTYNCATGLIFDEEGYIVELVSAGLAVRGTAEATQFTVTELTETSFMTTRIIPGNNQGSEHGGGLTPETKVYNVSTSGEYIGEPTELQMGDTVFCLIGSDGDARIIFVVNRMVESDFYYNLSRQYDSTLRETTRKLENGRYVFELACNGTTIKVWTKDKAIATKMDSYARYGFGLKLGENNEVLKVYDPENVTGWTSSPNNLYCTNITGRIAAFVSSVTDFTLTAPMTEDCKVYDVSELATNVGEPTELRVGDRCQGFRNINGEIVILFVTNRQVDGYMAWNITRKYDDTKKETTREPDENGYYVFDVIIDGKERTVKTTSKQLASKIDEKKPGAVGLQLSGNIVTGVYEAHHIVGGSKTASTFYVRRFTEDGFFADYTSVTGDGYWKANCVWADEYVVYNVSRNFNDHRGERTTLKIGDRIHVIRDKSVKTIVVFVYEREVDCEPYRKLDRFYDKEKGETTREPDENGWYTFQIMHKGELKTYKTKDKAVASQVDSYTYFFAMVTDGDIILRALPVDYVKDVTGVLAANFDIMSLNASGTKATLLKHYPGDTDVGTEMDVTFDKNCKFIDYCAFSETYGQEVKPQVGDRVYCLRGEGGRVLYCCIMNRVTREEGYQSLCPHCNKEVWWEPWYTGPIISQDQLHYYLATDVDLDAQITVGNLSRDFEVVFDLNGKTLTSEARGIYIYRNDKMVIMDTSKAQTGKIVAKGAANGTGGGVIQVAEGAEMTIMGGTYTMAPEHNKIQHGGIVYVTEGKMNVLGGTFIGGESDTYGGIIYVRDGDFSAKNATFSGGTTGGKGGIFYMDAKSRPVTFENCVLENGSAADGGIAYAIGQITFTDCTIKNGTATGNGGNIMIYDSASNGGNVILAGKTTVTGGTAGKNGGNIFISKDDTRPKEVCLTIQDQVKISGGSAVTAANNIGAGNAQATIKILGGTIEGDINIREKTSLVLAGAPVITTGKQYGLRLPVEFGLDVTGLKTGASIAVSTSRNGIFSAELADEAAAQAALGFFKADKEGDIVSVEGKALHYTVAVEIDPNGTYCPHCDTTPKWTAWNGKTALDGGHYVLEDNITVDKNKELKGGDVIIDLNGNKLDIEEGQKKLFTVYDSVKLVFIDSSDAGTGEVIGYQSGSNAGVAQVYGGDLDIYGGTFRLTDDSEAANGGLFRVTTDKHTPVVNIYGGEFFGGKATTGGILNMTQAVLNISGGTFHAGSASGGGDTFYVSNANAEVTISGEAVIEGGFQIDAAKNVTLSGKPTIQKAANGSAYSLKLDGAKIDATGLEEGAVIGISADGVFTTDFADPAAAEAAKAYFVCEKNNKGFEVQGNALAVVSTGTSDGETTYCPHCQQDVVFEPWANGDDTPGSGHYALASDVVTVSSYKSLNSGNTLVIDLNGKILEMASTLNTRMFYVQNNAKLVMMDSSAGKTGTVIGNQKDADPSKGRGIIQAYSGDVDIYGGIYRLNDGSVAGSGGILRISNQTDMNTSQINIYGGEFYGATATNGGIVYMTVGKLNIQGGTFHAGNVSGNGSTIYVGNAKAELTIGGTAEIDGGIYVANAKSVTLKSGVKIEATGLTGTNQIQVNAENVFTTDFADPAAAEAAKGRFTAPSGKVVEVQGNALAVVADSTQPDPDQPGPDQPGPDQPTTETCEHCGQAVTWTPWDGSAITAAGHYVLATDVVTVSGEMTLMNMEEVVIDLDGKTLQMDPTKTVDMFFVRKNCKLVILDSSEGKTGTVIGNQSSANNAGIFRVYSGNVDIYGGNFKLKDGAGIKQGGIFRITREQTTSEVNIYGGEFWGTTAADTGSIVHMTVAKLNIQGGTFHAGTAANGGNTIFVNSESAELTVGGTAVIDSGIYVKAAKSVTLKSGVKIDATSLAVTTPVALDAEGVFTTDFADPAAAEAAKALFTAPTGKEIAVQGSALAVVAGSTDPNPDQPNPDQPDPDQPDPDQPDPDQPNPDQPNPDQPTTETCEHCGQQVTWAEWHNGDATPGDGHYKLADDVVTVSARKSLQKGKTLVIDLNGKTLQMSSSVNNYMFLVNEGAKLVFVDSSNGNGQVIGNQSNAKVGIAYACSGDMDIYGGTFSMSANSAVTEGGLFRIIQDGKKAVPVVNIKGGTFNGTSVTKGSIIDMTYGTLNISGGTFNPGTATSGKTIYVHNSGAVVNISGNTVIHGGIQVDNVDTFTVSGNPTIWKAGDYGIKLAEGKFITVGALEATAKIGLTGSGVVVKGYPTAPDAIFGAKNFVADETGKFIAAKGEELLLSAKPTATTFDCDHCDETVEWQVWDGTAKPAAAGHYYLNGNVTPKGNFTLADYGTVVLNLNGYAVYKGNSGNVFLAQGNTELVFMDSSANKTGTVVANNNTTKDGVIANAYQAGSSVTIYGGNYLSGTPDVSARNGGLLYVNGGTVTINGGEFWGATTKKGGVVTAKAGTLEISGGVFHPGTASIAGHTICVEGTADVTIGGNAVIEGGVEIISANSVTLAGTPVIQRNPHSTATDYSLKTAVPVTVGTLAKGAKIAVNQYSDTVKVFAAFDNADAAKAAATYFYSDDPANAIVLDGTALGLEARAEGVADLKDPANDKTLNVFMMGNSFCYYYVEELYGLLMENLPEGVEEVQIYNLYYSGGKMSQHHEWWLNDEANYQLFKTDKNGRNAVSSAATLEMALALENWDYISMHCASTELDVLNGEHAALCQQIKTSAEPLLDRMYSLFPNAQLLWQRTWFFEVGCIRNGHTYTAQDGPKYDASIWAVADYICNEFDQNKPYDVKMVNSGAAWTEARALNEVANLLPTGGLCARKGVANEETYQYVKDNPTATDVGDGYHDGDIGGGQLLNAYIWYMTLTGDAQLNNNYVPATDNLAGYALSSELVAMLRQAALTSFNAN